MKKTIAVSALTLAALFACPLVSQAQAGGANPDPAAVQAGTYAVEPSHTRVTFSVMHFGFTQYFGEFVGATGQLVLDPKMPSASHLDVTVPVDGVSTTNAKLDGELKGANWFNAAQYPTISFHSTKVTLTGHGRATVAGTLTMHGVTRPVVLDAHFNAAGVNPLDKAYTAGFQVTGHIKRSDFGVSTYVPLVSDDVELNISAAFEKQS